MKQAIIVVWLITSAALCVAQGDQTKQPQPNAPNFTGTWEMNRSKSKVTRQNAVNRGGTVTLSITHNDPEITIIQKTILDGKERRKEFAYYTDGTGENNPTPNLFEHFYEDNEKYFSTGPRTINSRSSWKGKKLTTKYPIPIRLPDGRQTSVDVEEKWELSSDGNTLTQTTSFSSNDKNFDTSIEPRKLKKVFNKTS